MENKEDLTRPAADRPQMIIRLRKGDEKPEIWKDLFKLLKDNKECCDEVWFSTGCAFPKLETYKEFAEMQAECAKQLREIGIIPSLQIQTTLGHSDRTICVGGSDGQTWGHYVGVNGEQCQYINCPRQQEFLDYMYKMSEYYAQWHPYSVWIDDDLRLDNHTPAKDPCGCYCPHCLELFGKEEGRTFTREELVAEYKKDPELYKRWERFGINSLRLVAEAIVKGFHKHSPETLFALQHCHKLMRIPVMEALHEFSGKRVGSRPGGGAYSDHYPYEIINKGMQLSTQLNAQPGYDKVYQVCAEIESCPRSFACKTSYGHRLESMIYAAVGMDSLSYFIFDMTIETPEWIGKTILKPLAAEAPCYRDFFNHNLDTLPGGIGLEGHWDSCSPVDELGLPLIGVAFAAYSKYRNAYMLNRKAAETLPVESLEKMFAKGVILDGPAAMTIQERGLGYLIDNVKVVPHNKMYGPEYMTDDPINKGLEGAVYKNLLTGRYTFEFPEDGKVRVVGVYGDFNKNLKEPASIVFEKENGARVAILGYEAFFIHFINSDRVRFINRVCDWVAKNTLPVRPADALQCMLIPRITESGSLTSVTVVNVTIGVQEPFEIIMRGVPSGVTEATFNIPSEEPVKVALRHENGECRAVIPQLMPWGCGWLKIPKN